MIVKILQKSETFESVRYNTNKMEKDKGELVKVSGFGVLQGLDHLRPTDYINYLEAISAQSKRIKYPQFHAVISCKGQSHTKEQLAGIADEWLKDMGYGDQPYLLVFHKDTKNNHLHIVSTRIGKDGKKIDDAFEKLKAYQVLNRVMAADERLAVHADMEKALAYHFSTRAQFMMILEAQGYALKLTGTGYRVIKFGKELARLPLEKVDNRIAAYGKDNGRIKQLRAIIEKYRQQYDPSIHAVMRPLPGGRGHIRAGYISRLSELLRKDFGIEVRFHARDDKPPYGYTFLDHANKQVFKGGEIMDLKAFIAPVQQEQLAVGDKHPEVRQPMQTSAIIQDRESKVQGSETSNTDMSPDGISRLPHQLYAETYDTGHTPVFTGFQLDIADDIDDEAINGRNRRRKRTARINKR